MPALPDQPLTLSVLALFHRDVILRDVQQVLGDQVGSSERRVTNQIERLWDALLGGRERLETAYGVIKSAIARVEERLDHVDRRLDRLESDHRDLVGTVLRSDERLSRMEKRLEDPGRP
jgi:chromosome segregation ATPase